MNEKKAREKNFQHNILNIRIRELSGEREITPTEFAKALGVTAEAVRLWIAGYARPDIDKLMLISNFFGVSTDYLLGKSEVRNSDVDFKRIVEITGLKEQTVEIILDRFSERLIPTIDLLIEGTKYQNSNGKYRSVLDAIQFYLDFSLLENYSMITKTGKIRNSIPQAYDGKTLTSFNETVINAELADDILLTQISYALRELKNYKHNKDLKGVSKNAKKD